MFRLLYLVIYLKANLLYLLPSLWKAKRLEAQGRSDEFYDYIFKICYNFGNGLIKCTGSTVDVSGTEKIPDGSVLFVCNHQSFFDIPLMLGTINKPKSFIAKIETMNIPLISSWMKLGKCVFIDRDDARQSLKAINEGIEILKSGHSMVVFPEGTRSKSSEMLEFKKGSLRLATRSGVPIVPITISGSYKIFEANNVKIKPAHVKITVSEPIFTNNLTKEEESQLSDRVHKIIKDNL
ncbi:MAG: 1-acyl-sn-glycerol-3-phosphate acyltransferase [Alkaliphilus sp.]|nr:1-acyl-sn-glycerol-3-phosphate acyltransferase [Alkaliphilus sp.]